MDNKTLLYYVLIILIIYAQTSEMRPSLKEFRVNRLQELAKEVGML